MRKLSGWLVMMLLLVGFVGSGAAAQATSKAGPAAGEDILMRLEAIPGMKVLAERPTEPGFRYFLLSYAQPIDHRHPGKGTFEQRLTLLHKSTDRPMVLHTTGYNLNDLPTFRSEPTQIIDGNQISVEQRFFTPSRPDPANWTKLDIWQAATDHHRLFTALKPIYTKNWISTGASKGGMASVYHARFYPQDMDGVVAYVAPNDVVNEADDAYDRFFETVGTDTQCRQRVKGLATEALRRRTDMVARLEATAKAQGLTFNILKTADRAYENSVLDFEWAFWQFFLQADCAGLPDPATVSTDDLYTLVDQVSGITFYTDQGLAPFIPYYYQAGSQLGWPDPKFPNLAGLRNYPGIYQPRSYVPADISMRFDRKVMKDVDRWVRTKGSHLMFLYGQNDPWGAEPFRLGSGSRDSFWYQVAGLNHSGRLIDRLPAAEHGEATAALLRWAGVSAAQQRTFIGPLDTYDELQAQRRPL
jgi:PS-10 peptidase S37